MKLSKNKLRYGAEPNVITDALIAISQDIARQQLDGETFGGITDNSAGDDSAGVIAIPTAAAFSHTAGETTVVARTEWNAAMNEVDDAIAVLATYMNTEVNTPLGLDTITLNASGTVAVAGTVAAIDASMTGVDESGGANVLHSEAVPQIVNMRNNFATLIRNINQAAMAVGAATLADATGGKADTAEGSYVLADHADAATDGDPGDWSKVAADAALGAMADSVAAIATYIGGTLLDNTFLGTRAKLIVTA